MLNFGYRVSLVGSPDQVQNLALTRILERQRALSPEIINVVDIFQLEVNAKFERLWAEDLAMQTLDVKIAQAMVLLNEAQKRELIEWLRERGAVR